MQKIRAEKEELEKENIKMSEKIKKMTAEKQVSEDQIKTLQKRIMEFEPSPPKKEVQPNIFNKQTPPSSQTKIK